MACTKKPVGAPEEVEVTEEVKTYLDVALTAHNEASNDEKKVLVRITKVLRQVVAGAKYTVELVAEGEESKKQYSCQVVLLSQPWINPEPQVIKFEAKSIE